MPHKYGPNDMIFPEWASSLATTDYCLGEVVREAIVMRHSAIKAGAQTARIRACRANFDSAEATLESLRLGKVSPEAAPKRAADALRKFTQVYECMIPSRKR